jgi:glucosyl-3-phosphoglycerate synthase
MSDFAQSGLIATLQQLNPAHGPVLESELAALTPRIVLILPCHGADLERPALTHIARELTGAGFLEEVLLCTNHASDSALQRARSLFDSVPARLRILQTDSPRANTLLAGIPKGKGLNVWAGVGLLYHEKRDTFIALQDCDVSSFRREDLARLCYACAHPDLNYRFAKLYYNRATDRLYGRVSRLFFAPLLQALVRLFGHQPLTDFLLSFRYPLAGECAMNLALAATLPFSNHWGLETTMLCDVFRHVDPREVAQVASGTSYDHKHQPAAGALESMCAQIANALYSELAAEGVAAFSALRALASGYRREASEALRRSAHLARINGLPHDSAAEEQLVHGFAATLENPAPAPAKLLPWSVLEKKQPSLLEELPALLWTG